MASLRWRTLAGDAEHWQVAGFGSSKAARHSAAYRSSWRSGHI
jgi:hypothetical protein